MRWDYADFLQNYEVKTILDIGANTGQFADSFFNTDNNLQITCIEPNPWCYGKLRKLFATEKAVEIHHCAIGNEQGTTTLLVPKNKPRSKAGSLYLPTLNDKDDMLEIEVDLDTLDNLFLEDEFDLIKIDTQGNELEVILGGQSVLSRAKYIFMEVQTVEIYQDSPTSVNAIKALEKLGFRIHELIEVISNPFLSERNSVHIDLMFTKRDKHNYSCLQEYAEHFDI